MLVSKIGWMPMLVRGGGVKGGRAVDGWRQNGQAQQERAGLVEGSMKFNRESNLGVMLSTESRQSQARLMLWGWNGRRNFNPYSSTSAFGFDSARVGRIVRAFGASNKTVLKNDDCAYEQKLQLFKRNMLSDLDYEYDLFLQQMNQFFFEDLFDVYSLPCIKQILKNSTKKMPEPLISSYLFFRKKRRMLFDPSEVRDLPQSEWMSYYLEVQTYLSVFYIERADQIGATFEDLCLVYDQAGQVIWQAMQGQDKDEMTRLLHDNKSYVEYLAVTSTPEPKTIDKAFSILDESSKNLDTEGLKKISSGLSSEKGDILWTLYMANLIRAYDTIYTVTSLEEEDIRTHCLRSNKHEILQDAELRLYESIKEFYNSNLAVLPQ